MTLEQIITYIVVPALAGAGALWALIAKVVVPFILKDRSDRREFRQDTESVAFKQMIKITDTLIIALLKELEDKKRIDQTLTDLTKERVRTAEILSDIDIMFHKIEMSLRPNEDLGSSDLSDD